MSAEVELTEAANGISNAIRILLDLTPGDTDDHVCRDASLALEDAGDHLDDVITALLDGRLAEPPRGER